MSDADADPDELRNQLLPTLRSGFGQSVEWEEKLIRECREALSLVLPLTPAERGFLDALLDYGEIRPDLLNVDDRLSELVKRHPGLSWKAHNVRGRA